MGIDFNNYNYLTKYGKKELISIQSAPLWPEGGKHVSDEVTLNFSDGSQIVVSSSFADVDNFFYVEEDVVFDIKEEHNHKPFCNIGDTKITTVLVGEIIISIKVYFDEIAYISKKFSDKILSYPIGMFIRTPYRSVGICRDHLEASWLDADFRNADESLLYSLDSRWGGFEGVDPFVVKRQAKDYITGEVFLVDEEHFCQKS